MKKYYIIYDKDRNQFMRLYHQIFSQETKDAAIAYNKKHNPRKKTQFGILIHSEIIETNKPTIKTIEAYAKQYNVTRITIRTWIIEAFNIMCMAEEYLKQANAQKKREKDEQRHT